MASRGYGGEVATTGVKAPELGPWRSRCRLLVHDRDGGGMDLIDHDTPVLAGPSGAGKTTTADLLLKLYEPSGGEIIIDGHKLSETGPESIRRAIGVVAADGVVFRGTLADNIRYKRPQASDAEVLEAALAAGLSRTLERLPQGLATEVGEHGSRSVGGERQRLQIARMLVDKPRLLVLDEATANLDYATELEVKHALTLLSPRPTMLVIAPSLHDDEGSRLRVRDEGRPGDRAWRAGQAFGAGWLVCAVGGAVGRTYRRGASVELVFAVS